MSARTRIRLGLVAHWAQYLVLPVVVASAYVIITRDKRAAAEAGRGVSATAAAGGGGGGGGSGGPALPRGRAGTARTEDAFVGDRAVMGLGVAAGGPPPGVAQGGRL